MSLFEIQPIYRFGSVIKCSLPLPVEKWDVEGLVADWPDYASKGTARTRDLDLGHGLHLIRRDRGVARPYKFRDR